MTFSHYQIEAKKTAMYPPEVGILYPALSLSEEVGEVNSKLSKLIRRHGDGWREALTPEVRHALLLECGDVLWQLSALATDLGLTLEGVAWANLEKLADRAERNVIDGSGDSR